MHASPRPQTIQIFLPHGDPSGIRMAEITTRTVRVFDVPRSLLSGFLSMPEAAQVGSISSSAPTPKTASPATSGRAAMSEAG